MKKNILTIILIISVAFIWYKAFSRIWGNIAGDDVSLSNETNEYQIPISKIKRDSFNLELNYNDPFSYDNIEKKNQVYFETPSMKSDITSYNNPVTINWPQIKYKGMVVRRDSKNPLILLLVDNQDVLIRIKEKTYEGIELTYADKESVELKFKNQKKIFWRD